MEAPRERNPNPERHELGIEDISGQGRTIRPVVPSNGHGPEHRKYRGHHERHWGKILWRTLLGLLLVVVAYLVFIAVDVAHVSTNPYQLSGLSTDQTGRVNVLVLGIGDPGHAGEQLSDTMMVISLNTSTHRIAQISVPRDLRVQIPGYGSAKINAANAVGGISLAEQTVSNTLGISINYYALTDFSGLSNLVDAVGGLDVNVAQRLVDPEFPCANNQYASCGVDIEPGLQHMDGARVLQYVRCRKGTCGNDFGRAARQQQVLNLIRQKAFQPTFYLNPFKLAPAITAIRTGIKTNMSGVQLIEFALYWQSAEKNQPVNFVLSTSPGGFLEGIPGSSDLAPVGGSFSSIQNYAQNIYSEPITNSQTGQ